MDASLPERFGLVFTEIIATNKKLQDLGVEARSVILQAKLQIGTNDQLEELDKMATKAMKGVLSSKTINMKRCKWYNRGYCREGTRCPYSHPLGDCQQHLQQERCTSQGCNMRHRRRCKYWESSTGCFRGEQCQYLHQNSFEKVILIEEIGAVKENTNHAEKGAEYEQDILKSPISNKNNETQEKDSVEEEKLLCYLCKYNCDTQQIMTSHMKKEHKKKTGTCPLCNKDCKTISCLCDHFSENHMDTEINPTCYDEHMDIFASLYRAQLHESDDSDSECE